MKNITIALYNYEELNDKAKEKALKDWNQYNDDPFMQSHMINLLKEKLDERGIKYDEDSIDVRYSLSYSQGDGFMFEGTFSLDYGAGRCYTANVKHSGHYYHSKSRTIEWLDADTAEEASEDVGEEGKDYQTFVQMYEEVCKEMERAGYDHIEWITSEEYFIDACEANEYTFEANGTMRNA